MACAASPSLSQARFPFFSDDVVFNVVAKKEADPHEWACLSHVSTRFASLIATCCFRSRCLHRSSCLLFPLYKLQIVIGATNEDIPNLTTFSPSAMFQWVAANVTPFIPAVRISVVAVEDEVLESNDAGLASLLLPAMPFFRRNTSQG